MFDFVFYFTEHSLITKLILLTINKAYLDKFLNKIIILLVN
ncbi:hypothetical protein RAMDARK_0286 [Rickettsia amblyommatis str. Darkwater]|uniref:Uncharacterized protein n=1 Tax=Rickettsia amblyommatis str. Ac/Pa TaxID=1359164 RepID=A0A0F3N0L5_RICAM|nr:hypothetical protein APHACPA_0514 [Rickettsia amblyommatis str. Ac/Pa]KJV97648.1 hypothetical protein RAMDARK_0286 [Rickettsia amblyommatis str. Darkwater]